MRRIYFEDDGQDFLWWDLDDENNVVDCGPFQAWLWVGSWCVDSSITVGSNIQFLDKHKRQRTLVHRIEKIEEKIN